MRRPAHPADCRYCRCWLIWCVLTDHAFTMSDGAPEPFCRRCGWSTYWPARRTVGALLDRLASRWRRRRKPADGQPF